MIIWNITYFSRLYFIYPSTIPNIGGGTASKKGDTTIKKGGTYIHSLFLSYLFKTSANWGYNLPLVRVNPLKQIWNKSI